MVVFENRSAAYVWYVSTGSAENRHLQPGITNWPHELNGTGITGRGYGQVNSMMLVCAMRERTRTRPDNRLSGMTTHISTPAGKPARQS